MPHTKFRGPSALTATRGSNRRSPDFLNPMNTGRALGIQSPMALPPAGITSTGFPSFGAGSLGRRPLGSGPFTDAEMKAGFKKL